MTFDSEGVHAISNTTDRDRKVDVVFVHGLGGTSHSTWLHGKGAAAGRFFWPEELGRDLPQCGIWTVGYSAGITALQNPGTIIEQRASDLSRKLATSTLGFRPLIFVTHSTGGLVVKSLIVGSQTVADLDRKRLVSVIQGIVFCATPHHASAFADAVGVLGEFFGGNHEQVGDMRANAEPVDILNEQFIEWHRIHPILVDSYAENVGLYRTRGWRRSVPLGMVVPRASANPCIAGHLVHEVDADHLTIVKPPSREHDVYLGVVRLIRRVLAPAPQKPLPLSDGRANPHPVAEISPTITGNPDLPFEISRIVKNAPADLIGREEETALLADAWERALLGVTPRPQVLAFVAAAGEGKTALVAKWAADLAYHGWQGCEAVFAWSFHGQGARRQTTASSDVFLREALTVFGDQAVAASSRGAFEKGRRLSELVGKRRALLILDGLEPLQLAFNSPEQGALRDHGLAALLKGLATRNRGLCVVTTRYTVPDLRFYWPHTVLERRLSRLSRDAGVSLLRSLGVTGTQQEFATLVEDVNGHALSLTLLGTYLHNGHAGDIRRRDLRTLAQAGGFEQAGHVVRVMDAYLQSFKSDGERGKRALAVLRLLGLFDRPMSVGCLAALLREPVMHDLTDSIVGMNELQRNVACARLEAAKLIMVNRDTAHALVSLDTHPLLREYLASRLRTKHPGAWRAGHRRLYEHLTATTPDKSHPGLEDLEPLYQAVAHGCQAGMQQQACNEVYYPRINRRGEHHTARKLGALNSDLETLACFFEVPWSRVSASLAESDQAWLLDEVAFRLRATGRLTEALDPMGAALQFPIRHQNWKEAAVGAFYMSDLTLSLGEVAGALDYAGRSVAYADRSGDAFMRMSGRTAQANALHQAGRRADAEARFRDAEGIQANHQHSYPLLYAAQGFHYCDLQLAASERAAWQFTLSPGSPAHTACVIESCRAISRRAAKTLEWVRTSSGASPLGIALEHLTSGRAALYEAILCGGSTEPCQSALRHSADGLRRAGEQQYLPFDLLTRAWLRTLIGARFGADSAQADLDEAWDIAERGPMRLQMADIHLYRARLFFRETHYPWDKNTDGAPRGPKDDLADAEKLMIECGYHRRKDELEDARRVILASR